MENFIIDINEDHLSQLKDLYNGTTQIIVTLPNKFEVNIIVGILQNLEYLMERDKKVFINPVFPGL